jgi:hypothetical protein
MDQVQPTGLLLLLVLSGPANLLSCAQTMLLQSVPARWGSLGPVWAWQEQARVCLGRMTLALHARACLFSDASRMAQPIQPVLPPYVAMAYTSQPLK